MSLLIHEGGSESGPSRPARKRTAESTAGPGPSSTAAAKRKQLQACDECHQRRVRCIRENARQDCQACSLRGTRCTNDYITSAPKPNNRRKRASATPAQQASIELPPFAGPSTVAPAHTSQQPLPGRPGATPARTEAGSGPASTLTNGPNTASANAVTYTALESHQQNPAEATRHLLPLSAQDTRSQKRHAPVVDSDVSGAFGKHLVDAYYECLHAQCPAIPWKPFYQELVASGFSATGMETPEAQVLCLTVQALGARISDHPFIAGEDVPSRDNLPKGVDLSEYGRSRQPFCRSLMERAMRAFHMHGLVHRVSIRSIAAMVLLFWLWDLTHPTAHAEPRMLTSCALEQMRIIAEQEDQFPEEDVKEIKGGRLFWTIFLTDAIASARNGRQLQVLDSDIALFAPALLCLDPLLSAFSEADPARFQSMAAIRLWGGLTMVSRTICKHVTNPIVRRQGLTEAGTFQAIWEALDAHAKLSAWASDELHRLLGTRSSPFGMWIKALVCCRSGLVDLLNTCVEESLAVAEQRGDLERVVGLRLLKDESDRRSFAAHLELCTGLRTAKGQENQSIAFGGILLVSVENCIQRILSTPASHEGGQADFTLHDKITCIEVLLDNLKFTAYAWGSVGQQIRVAQGKLEQLKAEALVLTTTDVSPESFGQVDDLLNPFQLPSLFPNLPFNYDLSTVGEASFPDLEQWLKQF